MHCAKCKFQLNRVTLCVSDGNAYAGNNETEPCPNGCGPLWPVTWEQEARNCWKALEEMHERLHPAPTAQAESQPAPVEVADAMADSQYLAGVSAGWNAANADDPNAALQKLQESRAGYLKPLRAARAPADSAPAWASQAVIEYRYTGGTHWCQLGPAERMKPNFDGVYRLQGGVFPVDAPADSVREDAARYRWLFGARTDAQTMSVSETVFKPLPQDEVLSHLQGFYMSKTVVDELVDAARKQGEKP